VDAARDRLFERRPYPENIIIQKYLMYLSQDSPDFYDYFTHNPYIK
jgi:hypothetical protein